MNCSTESVCFSPPVFCDWLDVTFPSGSPLWGQIVDFLSDCRCSASRVKDSTYEYRHPAAAWGNFQLHESSRGWSRLSASGGSCAALRDSSAFSEFLAIVGCNAHTLTRLDATMDVRVQAPPVISDLVSRYPPGHHVHLTRKGVLPAYNLQPTGDGGLTGTFYAGPLRHGKSKVSARVYDKRAEIISRTGEDPGPLVRYEVTVRKGVGATLRDAENPTPVFWHHAAPALLPPLPGIPPWSPFTGDTWAPGPIPVDPREKLRRRVESSVDLDNLLQLADSLAGDGRRELLRMLRSRLGVRDVAIS